ncbi:MAG: helix-turn-helix domain-containing protein [Gammaproteobacteria bacterium]|nr:helix-turn-helix domain-containing protein [Gammaproteobacteria bacterium]
MISEDSKDFITSIARCMDVIRAFDSENAEMTPADVAAKTNLTRATARRILLTLNTLGYVASDGKWFRLSPKILDLGFSYLTSMKVGQVIQPIINTAGNKVGETCAISVIEGTDSISVALSAIDRYDRVSYFPGTRFPAYVSAAGRAIMAEYDAEKIDSLLKQTKLQRFTEKTITSKPLLKKELDKIKQQGFACVDSELEIGLFTLAVPVRNDLDKVVAAVTFGGNVARINNKNIKKKFLPDLQKVAREIGQLLPDRHHIM